MEFVSPEGLRLDGRRPPEIRLVNCKLGVLERADGSAVFEMGNTKVLAAVYGPHEVTKRSETLHDRALIKCEYSLAAFSTGERRKRPKTDRRSVELSLVIRETLEAAILTRLMPRSQIDIYLQVLQADGGTRCASINAATLALAEAGVPMRDITAACAAGFLDGTPLLDLNYVEDSGGGPDLTVGYMPRLELITLLQMDSKIAVEEYEKVCQLAVSGCRAIADLMRQALMEYTQTLANMANKAVIKY